MKPYLELKTSVATSLSAGTLTNLPADSRKSPIVPVLEQVALYCVGTPGPRGIKIN